MIAVSDTSPLLYLFLIDLIDLLPKLFDQVIIPEAVMGEISVSGAPSELQNCVKASPSWLTVRSVEIEITTSIQNLDTGEQSAISLAKSLDADILLIDEKLGRQAAIFEGLEIIGVLGILDEAASQGIIDLETAITQLQRTNFRVSSKLMKSLLNTHREG